MLGANLKLSNLTKILQGSGGGGGGGADPFTYNGVKFNATNVTGATSMTSDSAYVYVLDSFRNVQKYSFAGAYQGSPFGTAGQVLSPQGLVWDTVFFWANYNSLLYQYNSAGVYTGFFINLAGQMTSAVDITWDGSHLCVLANTGIIYKYTRAGVYTGLSIDVTAPVVVKFLDWDGTHFWGGSDVTDRIYKYDALGVYTGLSFDTSTASLVNQGFTAANSNMYMVSTFGTPNSIYVFEPI